VIAATRGAGHGGAAGGGRQIPSCYPEGTVRQNSECDCKDCIQVHAVDADGATVIRKRLRRAEVLSFLAGLEPCLIGMEPARRRIIGRVN
jgi:hypothetical protein